MELQVWVFVSVGAVSHFLVYIMCWQIGRRAGEEGFFGCGDGWTGEGRAEIEKGS